MIDEHTSYSARVKDFSLLMHQNSKHNYVTPKFKTDIEIMRIIIIITKTIMSFYFTRITYLIISYRVLDLTQRAIICTEAEVQLDLIVKIV